MLTVNVVYVYPNLFRFERYVHRFVRTFKQFTPGKTKFSLVIVVNGLDLSEKQKELFDGLNPTFINHDNSGKDIGAFIAAANAFSNTALQVCFGTYIHFHQPNWLDRITDVYASYGPGLYGCWSYAEPRLHIRTTAFWLPAQLLLSYPSYVSSSTRYEFEHGKNSILTWVHDKLGFNSYIVSWSRTVDPYIEPYAPNLDDSLVWDQFTARTPAR